ncbi:MAG: hypothetical protein C4289_14540 [Chloroflexota bacterium]
MQNIGRAFTYPFEDPRWVAKLGIGVLFTLLSFLLIGIPFVLGYMLETIRNVARGDERPLPEWDNLGGYFAQGLAAVLVFLIYAIPYLLLAILAAMSGDRGGASALFGCLGILYALVLWFISPAVMLRFALTRDFAAAIQIPEIISFIQRNIGNYVLVFLLYIVASIIGSIGFLALCIGVIFTTFYSYLIDAYLLGLLQRAAGGEDILPVRAPGG